MKKWSLALALLILLVIFLFSQGSSSSDADGPTGGSPVQNAPGKSANSLSASDIAFAAQTGGFTGADLVTAIAIALAESGGNANAYNPETAAGTPAGKGSYGLWQIYLKAHPEYAGFDLTDPVTNATAAFEIYSKAGNSFRPWSTFKNGAFTAYVQTATEANAIASTIAQPGAGDSGASSSDSGDSGS